MPGRTSFMSLSNLFGVLQQYAGQGALGPNTAAGNTATDPEKEFQHVAQNASQEHLAGGLADAFRSNGSSGFPQMVSSLFSQSNGQQQAGILNHLIGSLGPGASSGILGSVLGSLGGGQTQVQPDQASQVPPETVHQLATEAQKNDPSIVDKAGSFYAQHPTLVQGLGAGALALIMSHMSNRNS